MLRNCSAALDTCVVVLVVVVVVVVVVMVVGVLVVLLLGVLVLEGGMIMDSWYSGRNNIYCTKGGDVLVGHVEQ